MPRKLDKVGISPLLQNTAPVNTSLLRKSDFVDPVMALPRDLSKKGGIGNLLKSVAAGSLGIFGDLGRLVPGAEHSLLGNLPTTDDLANKFGADFSRPGGMLGMVGAPDPADIARLGGKGLLAMTLFHGTPHKFDRFALDKIGTGEGAQAFGHGLYFAENPGVARSYQNVVPDSRVSAAPAQLAQQYLGAASGKQDDAVRFLQDFKDEVLEFGDTAKAAQVDEAIEIVRSGKPPGHLYEVEIPDEVTDRMLDWDAPLSEQPESVRKLLEENWIAHPDMAQNMTGEQIYKQLAMDKRNYSLAKLDDYNERLSDLNDVMQADSGPGYRNFRSDKGRRAAAEYDRLMAERAEMIAPDSTSMEGMQRLASDELRDIGIPGIRFYDGSSRARGEGTRNIVVFDPDDITQVKRDGELVWENKSGIKPK